MRIITYVKEKLKSLGSQTHTAIDDSFETGLRLAMEAIDILDTLRLGWGAIPDRAKLKLVEQARAKLADLVTLKRSFRQLAEDKRAVRGESESDSETTPKGE